MRVFVALNLPKKERERIYRAARPLRDGELPVRWVEPDAFHVTMKFLGEVRQDRIPDVHEALGRVAASTPPFSIRLGGFGAFPTIRKPRVIWLGVGASPELRCLKQDIEWGLSDCGFEWVDELHQLPEKLNKALELDGPIEKLAEKFVDKHHALFLGRGSHFPIAMEGALKPVP